MNRVLAHAGGHSHNIFNCFKQSTNILDAEQLTKDNVLVLHGGGDISPSLYNRKLSKLGYGWEKPTWRDEFEWACIKKARELSIPIIGICRGAQLLCAYDGGTLVQHIENHTGGYHNIVDEKTGEKIKSNSCHHQMMVMKDGHKNLILAQSNEPVLGYDEDAKPFTVKAVPEVVYFSELNAIGIQGHPEWMHNSPFTNYCSTLIQKYLLGD